MKRDCGEGELKPVIWSVVSCIGFSDDETELSFPTKEEALTHFEKTLIKVKEITGSNVRLYACDKQGYCNCMKSYSNTVRGEPITTDRMSELSV